MLAQILHTILIAAEVLLIFNLLIVVHELGHFLAGRWRGLVIDEFGIWFGKPIWRKKFGGVWYSLGSIPAGGFVKLPQLAPMDAIEGESEERPQPLPAITPIDKIIVALAGPVFSFLLAVVMATIVWGVGKPVHEFEVSTVIGYVKPDGPADKAGLKPGDRILEVDGKPVDRFIGPLHAVTWRVVRSEGETIPFKIERDGRVLTIDSGWEREENPKWKRKGLRKVYIAQRFVPSIGKIDPGSPAAAAGLQEGDLITMFNNQPVVDLSAFFTAIEKTGTDPIALTVERNGRDETVHLTPAPPKAGSKTPQIGVAWGRMMLVYPDPLSQVADAVATIRNMLDALLSPKSDVKAQHFSGPVGILRTYYNLFADEQGWRLALAFSVFFNVNLALFNLLPFPVLDGGHITLAIFEAIRRRPIQGALLEYVQTACAIAVMSFIAYVTFFDVSDLFSVKKDTSSKKEPAEMKAPAAPSTLENK
jgi:regulator of sigma E protease